MKVLLGGEGPTDIGDWAKEPQYRSNPPRGGVVESVLVRVKPGARIADGVPWKSIRKYRPGGHASPEERNVLGLVLLASERRYDAVVFARDRDGDTNREAVIDAAIQRAHTEFPAVRIAGGVAVKTIESWLLSLLGDLRAESLSDPKSTLATDHAVETVDQKVAVAAGKPLTPLPPKARSLQVWLARVSAL